MVFSKYLFPNLTLVVDWGNVMNVRRAKTVEIIPHDTDYHVDVCSKKFFQQLWDYLYFSMSHKTSLFDTFYNFYLTHDSVYNDTWSYRNIQVRKRIRIIFK